MWLIALTLILIIGIYSFISNKYFIYHNTHHIKIDNIHKIKDSNNPFSNSQNLKDEIHDD